jgi:hypothetical protein
MGRKEQKNDSLPGSLDMLILGTLSRRDLRGYGIVQLILARIYNSQTMCSSPQFSRKYALSILTGIVLCSTALSSGCNSYSKKQNDHPNTAEGTQAALKKHHDHPNTAEGTQGSLRRDSPRPSPLGRFPNLTWVGRTDTVKHPYIVVPGDWRTGLIQQMQRRSIH